MKITFAIPLFDQGGGQRFISTLANFYDGCGYDVSIISLRDSESFFKLSESIEIVKLNYVPIQTKSKVSRFLSRIQTFFELRRAIKNLNPNFVFSILSSTNILTLSSTRFLGVPVYVNDVMSPMRRRTLIERVSRKIFYPLANGIICMTEEAKEIIANETGCKNIKVIPRPLKEMENLKELERTKSILNVGRLHPDKGQSDLIEAFAKTNVKDWKLIFLGDGPLKKQLIERCKELGVHDNVNFIGAVTDVDPWYYSCSIFAFTSYNEGFPNALSEAMHASMACVSYDCISGPKEIIENGVSGRLIPVGNTQALSEALDDLMSDEKNRQFLGQNANINSAKYSIDNIASQILSFCWPCSGENRIT